MNSGVQECMHSFHVCAYSYIGRKEREGRGQKQRHSEAERRKIASASKC